MGKTGKKKGGIPRKKGAEKKKSSGKKGSPAKKTTYRVNARYGKGEITLEKIRLSVVEELVERGYHQTSICDVVNRANLTRGAFYNYWDSLDTCILDVLDYLREDESFRTGVTELMQKVGHPSVTFQLIKALLTLTVKKKWKAGFVSMTLLQEKAIENQILRKRIEENLLQIQKEWENVIKADIESGVFRDDLKPEGIASGVMNLIGGILQQELLGFRSLTRKSEEAILFFMNSLLSESGKKHGSPGSVYI